MLALSLNDTVADALASSRDLQQEVEKFLWATCYTW